MRALITGISGFVGSHLAEYLLAHTDWEVAGTVYGLMDNIAPFRDRLALYPAELSQPDVVRYILQDARPDHIYHLAAQPITSLSQQDPWFTLENNIRVQLNILEGVVRLGLKCRVLVVGSSEEYGRVAEADLPVDEETPLRPVSPYGLSKIAQDFMGLQYHLNYGVATVRARPFNHIGPRQRLGFVAADFASQIAEIELGRRPAQVSVGDLSVARDFSDVRDIVRGYHLLLAGGLPGEVYNLGSGEPHTVGEILTTLARLSGQAIEVVQDPARMRPVDVPCMAADCSKIEAQVGWKTQIPFEQSLRDVLDFWREQVRQGVPDQVPLAMRTVHTQM